MEAASDDDGASDVCQNIINDLEQLQNDNDAESPPPPQINDNRTHSSIARRRYKIIISLVCLILVAIIIAIAITLTTKNTSTNSDELNNSLPLTSSSSIPSTSPSNIYRLSNPPSITNSLFPSMSITPTNSPTNCVYRVSSSYQTLDLPISNTQSYNTRYAMDDNNAVVITFDNVNMIYISFYTLQPTPQSATNAEGDASPPPRVNLFSQHSLPTSNQKLQWVRNDVYTFQYSYPTTNEYSIDISDNFAMLGLPIYRNGAGLVYLFEKHQRGDELGNSADDNDLDIDEDTDTGSEDTTVVWEFIQEPILPNDAWPNDQFGHTVSLTTSPNVGESSQSAVVSALIDKAIYIFQKTDDISPDVGTGEEVDEQSTTTNGWNQLTKLDLNYIPNQVYVAKQTILVLDSITGEIHFYKYDTESNKIIPSQESIVSNPNLNEYEDASTVLELVNVTGSGKLIDNVAVDEDTFAYSTLQWMNDTQAWDLEGVYIYNRPSSDDQFTLLQFLNASIYGFESTVDIDIDDDILLIGSTIFSKQSHGYYVESYTLNGQYINPQLSGRRILAELVSPNDNDKTTEIISLDIEDCTQGMPTQLPSTSMAPMASPSSSIDGSSSIRPTLSYSPTSTLNPSSSPSSSIHPSTSLIPSYTPTTTSIPTMCYNVKIVLMTTGSNYTDIANSTSWELYEKDTQRTVLQGGPFIDNSVEEYVVDCLDMNDYIFSITNTNGQGFGDDCTSCGYFVFVDGVSIGGNINFFYNDKLAFPLPLVGGAEASGSDNDDASLCSGDFFLRIETDNNPEEITWILVNVKGDTVLSGKYISCV